MEEPVAATGVEERLDLTCRVTGFELLLVAGLALLVVGFMRKRKSGLLLPAFPVIAGYK